MKLNELITDPAELKALHRQKSSPGGDGDRAKNWSIRTHRALSWFEKSMVLAGDPDLSRELAEARLIMLWIGLGALCNRWDEARKSPMPESEALHAFMDELTSFAPDQLLPDFTGRNQPLIRRLLSNPTLHADFWTNSCSSALADKIDRTLTLFDKKDKALASTKILNEVVYRVFILRSQLVHGSSTAGGRLNREVLSDALQFLQRLVPMVIHVTIECGADHEWPVLCYPPVDLKDKDQVLKLTRKPAS
jgi:hypothetical protein